MWCQVYPLAASEKDPRFVGGLGIFAATNPWGPWETVYYTRDWDIGPGESVSMPTKWISPDGKSAYLVFSGGDYFSARKVVFEER